MNYLFCHNYYYYSRIEQRIKQTTENFIAKRPQAFDGQVIKYF